MYLHDLNDVLTKHYQYLIIQETSYQVTERWYGPPDPVPTEETHYKFSLQGFNTKEELLNFLEINPPNYKLLEVTPLKVIKETKISLQ